MGPLINDLLYGLRLMRNARLFTLLVVASLGIGIGANAAIFTLLDQIVLRPLPVQQPGQLVQLTIDGEFVGDTWGDGSELPYPMFLDLRSHSAFTGMLARFPWAIHVSDESGTERLNGELVSGRYFSVLGVTPAVGRVIADEDDHARSDAVAVLSHAYWRSRYNANPKIVGQKVTINNHPFTVVGVAGEGFTGIDVGRATQVFVPMALKPQMTPGWNGLDERRDRFVQVFARLRDGVEIDSAEVALDPIFRNIRRSEMTDATFAGKTDAVKKAFLDARLDLVPAARGRSGLAEYVSRSLWILMCIGGVVLLVACANIAGLLLARGMGRHREVAIRLALGASRGRIAAQLMTESLILGAVGAAAGMLVASWAIGPLTTLLVGSDAATALSTTPDLRVILFTTVLGCVTAMLFGLVPAIQASRSAFGGALKDRTAANTAGQLWARKALVASQVALALLLVVGAALFLRSLMNLVSQHPGFEPSNLVAFRIEPSLNGYDPDRVKTFIGRLDDDLRRAPGISDVGIAALPILSGGSWNSGMTVVGANSQPQTLRTYNHVVMPGYFAALRVPLIAGRDFTDHDRRTEPGPRGQQPYRVAIANKQFVDDLKQSDPLGARVGFGQDPGTRTPIQIVGVVGTAKYIGMKSDAGAQLFFPMLEGEPRALTVYVRTTSKPEATFGTIRRVVQEIDPTLPIYSLVTMEAKVQQSVADDRLIASLATVLASIGVLLCVVGLYGVMSYTVSRRTREVGIRIALGARASQVTSLFFREALVVVGLGIVCGIPLLWMTARFVQAQLYGIDALDFATIGAAVASLASVALLGAFLPTVRAARIQPLAALREE